MKTFEIKTIKEQPILDWIKNNQAFASIDYKSVQANGDFINCFIVVSIENDIKALSFRDLLNQNACMFCQFDNGAFVDFVDFDGTATATGAIR